MAWPAVLGVLRRWAPRRCAIPRLVDRNDAAEGITINTFYSNNRFTTAELVDDGGDATLLIYRRQLLMGRCT